MRKNLLIVAGLSHSGKDLLLGQIMKLGKMEPELGIDSNIVSYDWLLNPFMQKTGSYTKTFLPVVFDKILTKVNTLIYIHDITFHRYDDTVADFQRVISSLKEKNDFFQVVLILNRGHLITDENERNKIKNDVLKRLQAVLAQEFLTYIVSLKGDDELRRTNLIFTQIINKAKDFEKHSENSLSTPKLLIDSKRKEKINQILQGKITELKYSGAYLLSNYHEILLAIGKSQGWQEKIGPIIIKKLDKENAFDIAPSIKTKILRIEDFILIIHSITSEVKLILIGQEPGFKLNSEPYLSIEQICEEISKEINSELN